MRAVGEYAWYSKNSDNKAHKVGTRNPMAWDSIDMSANVWEWCSDWYGSDYYQNSPKDNPIGQQAALTGCFVVAVGTTSRGTCARPIATTSPPAFRAATWLAPPQDTVTFDCNLYL